MKTFYRTTSVLCAFLLIFALFSGTAFAVAKTGGINGILLRVPT